MAMLSYMMKIDGGDGYDDDEAGDQDDDGDDDVKEREHAGS